MLREYLLADLGLSQPRQHIAGRVRRLVNRAEVQVRDDAGFAQQSPQVRQQFIVVDEWNDGIGAAGAGVAQGDGLHGAACQDRHLEQTWIEPPDRLARG